MAETQGDVANRRPSELTRDEWQELRDQHITALGAAQALGTSDKTVARYWRRHGITYEHSSIRRADRVRIPVNSSEPEYAVLLAVLKRKNASHSVIDIANALNCPPREVERLAGAARADGYDVDVSNEDVNLQRAPDHERRSFDHDFYGEHFKIGIFGDTQYGSSYAAEREVAQFFAFCRQEKVQALYHTGDVTDGNGVYPGHIRELRPDCLNADAQAERAAQAFVAAGLPIYFILGNHDLKWYRDIGFDVGLKIEDRAIQLGAKHPIKCLGHEDARVRLGTTTPCLLDILHPSGGTPYAISYRSQKIVADMEGGDKPHIVAVGHLHKAEDLPHIRNVVAIQPGCFQWQTPFMRKKPTPAHVAGCVIEGWMTRLEVGDSEANDRSENGVPTLTRLRYEWLKFYAPKRMAAG